MTIKTLMHYYCMCTSITLGFIVHLKRFMSRMINNRILMYYFPRKFIIYIFTAKDGTYNKKDRCEKSKRTIKTYLNKQSLVILCKLLVT